MQSKLIRPFGVQLARFRRGSAAEPARPRLSSRYSELSKVLFRTVYTSQYGNVVKEDKPFHPRVDYKTLVARADEMRTNIQQRKAVGDIDKIVSLYKEMMELQHEATQLRRQRNTIADEMKSRGSKMAPEEKAKQVEMGKSIRDRIAAVEKRLEAIDAELLPAGTGLPNFTHPESPLGEEGPRIVKWVGEKPTFEGFTPKSHMEIGQDLDLLHFPVLSGKGKTYYTRNDAALLELALVQWALATVSQKYGFIPHTTPDIMNIDMVEACGFQPRGVSTQVYKVENEDLCLVGTAEIPLASLYYNCIIPEKMLPIKLAAFGHCFRAEAGDSGTESKGLYRVHQFSKVEMFVFAKPEDSEKLHQELLEIEIDMLTQLGFHFKVMDMPRDDLGASAYRKYDIEAWMPSRNNYGEVTSCSNCTDYQSRRLNTRYRDSASGDNKFVHTLNATAIAVPRVTLAILENFQQADGSVRIPDPLVPFMLGKTHIMPVKKL